MTAQRRSCILNLNQTSAREPVQTVFSAVSFFLLLLRCHVCHMPSRNTRITSSPTCDPHSVAPGGEGRRGVSGIATLAVSRVGSGGLHGNVPECFGRVRGGGKRAGGAWHFVLASENQQLSRGALHHGVYCGILDYCCVSRFVFPCRCMVSRLVGTTESIDECGKKQTLL